MAKKQTRATANKTKKRSAPESAAGRQSSLGDIHIRMYRQGLGDCFLLSFPRRGAGSFHMLIDCGVILGTPNAGDKMTAVAKDIAAATDDHLHVVVATHEHWDHLSGFIQAQEVFNDIAIDEVWFAWTEDPTDELARRLRHGHERTLRALQSAARKMTGLSADRPDGDRLRALTAHVGSMLDFFGPVGAAGRAGTRDALDYLAHGHPKSPRVRFCRPGEPPIALPEVPGARVFVLGPPHDEKLIKRSNPTKTGKEVYEIAGLRLDPDTAFFAAVGGPEADATTTNELADAGKPFDAHLRIAPEAAERDFYKEYGPRTDPDRAWRRIDDDWLGVAEDLALNLDSDTNNTSLALAIELEPGGRVLLFPGDAQVGNWLSWEQLHWPGDTHSDAPVTAADLLKRTVMYKVGHHASHNATLRAKGLELMDSPDLVALIPVDHKMAVKKRWLGMPFPALLKRLNEKARGRILRVDEDEPDQPDDVPSGLWSEFKNHVTATKDYFEYVLPGASD